MNTYRYVYLLWLSDGNGRVFINICMLILPNIDIHPQILVRKKYDPLPKLTVLNAKSLSK